MDAIEILGDLLGRKTQAPGRGADVLRDIFGRGSQQASRPPSATSRAPVGPESISREAEKLERLTPGVHDLFYPVAVSVGGV